MRKRTGFIVGGVAVLALASMGACGGGDEGATTAVPTAAATHSPTASASKAAPSQAPSSGDTGKAERRLSRKVEHQISLKGAGFPCHWKVENDANPRVLSCEKHQILTATSTDPSAVKVWAESMDDQMDVGWMVTGEKYAVVSPDHGTINRVMDLLGGGGKVEPLG